MGNYVSRIRIEVSIAYTLTCASLSNIEIVTNLHRL